MFKHSSNKKTSIIILGLVLVFMLVFFSQKYTQEPREMTDVTVSLKWLHQTQFAGMYVAHEKGWYRKKGINLDFKEFNFNEKPIEDIYSGEAEFALGSTTEFLTYYGQRQDIIALAAIYQVSPFVIVSLEGQDITSPYDLLGKTLGVKGGARAEAETVYQVLLESAGLSLDDINFNYVSLETSEKDDLLSEEIDAIGMYRTRLDQVFGKEIIPYNLVYPERHGVGLYNDIIFADKSFVSEHPLLVEDFIHTTIRGWNYALKHPEEAIDITLKYVRSDQYKDREYLESILRQSTPLIKASSSSRIGEMEQERWEDFYRILLDKNVIKDSFDVKGAFTLEFLK